MKYFDRTFWKMLLGFVALLFMSIVILISVKIYQSDARPTDSVVNIATP